MRQLRRELSQRQQKSVRDLLVPAQVGERARAKAGARARARARARV